MVTRRDLSPGDQATQAVHAAFRFGFEHQPILRHWHEDSQYLVLLAVEDERALDDLLETAASMGIPYSNYYEPDFCDEHGNPELTAIALAPTPSARRLCANFPLALKDLRKVIQG